MKLLLLLLISFNAQANLISIDSVHNYNCIYETGNTFESKNYYYIEKELPRIIKEDETSVSCHNNTRYGNLDSPQFPRLNTIASIFYTWNKYDLGFYDLDNDGRLDIHNQIDQEVFNHTGHKVHVNIFNELELPLGHYEATGKIGYYMRMIQDSSSNKKICPTTADYYGQDAIMKAIGNVVGIDTETFFKANAINSKMINDDLYLGQNKISKIWWHVGTNGQLSHPSKNDLKNKTIYFFWPANESAPFIKHSNQKTFRVERDLNTGDLAKGCIPALNP